MPTPEAAVADNDLALGRIVDAISHSRFWPDTCIFVVEDDPQTGFDHIDGHRTIAQVISPYTRRKFVDSTNYNQTSMVRTIELILGLPPMNQLDSSATPMASCFTDEPDLTPYNVTPNIIPLDKLNPDNEHDHQPAQPLGRGIAEDGPQRSRPPTRTRSTASSGTPAAAATTPIPPGPSPPRKKTNTKMTTIDQTINSLPADSQMSQIRYDLIN